MKKATPFGIQTGEIYLCLRGKGFMLKKTRTAP